MISLQRLKGGEFWLNPDLIVTVESNPDTRITLSDGRTLLVADSADEVATKVRDFRASVLVVAEYARKRGGHPTTTTE